MPRFKRTKTVTKVYHIIIRGTSNQDLFFDKQDFQKFIEEIKNTKEKYKYKLYAYSLMNDHVHFILYDEMQNMSTAIQSLNVRYSTYYNKKYERTGHLYENRFKSKIVENVEYIRNLVRYIHKNPENAGLEAYRWTSYKEYLYKPKLINSDTVLKLFGDNKEEAIRNFKEFHNNYYKYQDIDKDFELLARISDEEAFKIIQDLIQEKNPLKIQLYSKEKRYKVIEKIIKIEGIKKEQIARILGISRKTIRNIEKNSQKGQISQKETSQMGT